MKNYFMLGIFLFTIISNVQAGEKVTHRIPQISNSRVTVWKTIIYPSKQILAAHRHDHDRVVVALSDGVLKITNNKGKIHYWTLKKDKAYYFTKDIPNELHNDENVTSHPITVMVIELNDSKKSVTH